MIEFKKLFASQSLRTFGIFAGGNVFVALLGGIGGILQAKWISPETFGSFKQYGILTSYLYFGLIFVHDGLQRQYPFLIGQGKAEDALRVAASAKWWYLLLSCCFTVTFIVLSAFSLLNRNWYSAVGWAAQIPCVWASIYGLYLGVMYRSSFDFRRLSYNQVLATILGFIAIVLVRLMGYWGLALRFILQHASSVIIYQHYVPVKVSAIFSKHDLLKLAKISLPLALPGYIQTSCLSATISIMVLGYCGQSGLGIYGFAMTLQAMALTFTASLHQMFSTKLTYKYGETRDIRACLHYARLPAILSICAAAGIALVIMVGAAPFIRILLPRYEAAIPIVRLMLVSLPLSAACLPLILLRSALLYKHVIVVALTRFIVTFLLVAVLPKTLAMICISALVGEFSSLVTGLYLLYSSTSCSKDVSNA